MARSDNEVRITLSILDRLLDFAPDISREPPTSRAKSLRDLKQSVRRDLEWLLNTRNHSDEIANQLEEVSKSMAVYGLTDFTGMGVKSPGEQKMLVNSLEAAIRIFEPRLMDLRVNLEPIDEIKRVLRFRIEARLKVDPVPEPITFDTVLQMGSGQFEVVEK